MDIYVTILKICENNISIPRLESAILPAAAARRRGWGATKVPKSFPHQNQHVRIAVVDNDEEVTELASTSLRAAGYGCSIYRTGRALLAALRSQTFDLLLLDWNLSDNKGVDLLQSVRGTNARSAAVIILTSRSEKDDMIAALRAGADDYVVKSEAAPVLIARVEAVLRRTKPATGKDRLLSFGRYTFDRLTRRVRMGNTDVTLSAKEFQLALTLFENIHRALARSYLLETIWQSLGDLPTRTLDMHVSRVRTKLDLTPENGYRIAAVSGYGYRMESFGADEFS